MFEWIGNITPGIATVISAIIVAAAGIWAGFKARRDSRQLSQFQNKLQADMMQNLDHFRDSLERQRTFSVFQRDTITSHLNKVVQSFIELYTVAEIVGLKSWLSSANDLETERNFKTSYYNMEIHFAALRAFGVIPEEIIFKWDTDMGITKTKWDDLLGEATRRTEAFQQANPGERGFSSTEFGNKWIDLMVWLDKMIRLVTQIPAKINLPK